MRLSPEVLSDPSGLGCASGLRPRLDMMMRSPQRAVLERCPHGSILRFVRARPKRSHQHAVRLYRCRTYKECPYRTSCTKTRYGRVIEISEHHGALVSQRAKRTSSAGRALLKKRKVLIEPVFSWIKCGLNFMRWDFVGLEKVRAQWSMICSTINLRKLYGCWLTGGVAFGSV